MLFLSRLKISRSIHPRNRQNRFYYCGIVDTDDWKESFVLLSYARKSVLGSGLEVKGLGMHTVVPYQLPEYCTAEQAKVSLLGVDIHVYNGVITYISWREPCAIRLSDFGSSCADMIIDMPSEDIPITLILDDKIKYREYSFWENSGTKRSIWHGLVQLDLTECSDIRLVREVYRWCKDSEDSDGNRYVCACIKDIPARKKSICARYKPLPDNNMPRTIINLGGM